MTPDKQTLLIFSVQMELLLKIEENLRKANDTAVWNYLPKNDHTKKFLLCNFTYIIKNGKINLKQWIQVNPTALRNQHGQ